MDSITVGGPHEPRCCDWREHLQREFDELGDTFVSLTEFIERVRDDWTHELLSDDDEAVFSVAVA